MPVHYLDHLEFGDVGFSGWKTGISGEKGQPSIQTHTTHMSPG